MCDLEPFRRELTARQAAAKTAPRWTSEEMQRYMAAFRPRRQLFDETVRSLVSTVIGPRLEALAKLFPSARMTGDEPAGRCCCWFASCDRYPVTAKVEFAVEHDESVQHLFVRYQVYLMPVFFQFEPNDRLTLPLDRVDSERVCQWVEERILEFLDTYLRHDRGAEDLEEDVVTDPVCGMRLRRSDARERADYRGHGYFFCSDECLEKFQAGPGAFVTFRTM